MRRLLLLVPLGVVAAALAVLIIQPWGGEEAQSTTPRFGLCNVTIDAPEGVNVVPADLRQVPSRAAGAVNDFTTYRLVKVILPTGMLLPSGSKATGSDVHIDAQTGEIVSTDYANDVEQAYLETILATMEVKAVNPLTGPWPYSERTTTDARDASFAVFGFRRPGPASGLFVHTISADGESLFAYSLVLHNCRSWARVQYTFRVDSKDSDLQREGAVSAEDQAAFDNFFTQVTVKEVRH